ncbi:MAG TPA: hypothetical protein VN604_08635 [Nitrospirota bacterium]|nr:hypothetical protein [Nitrospirota bacterium]
MRMNRGPNTRPPEFFSAGCYGREHRVNFGTFFDLAIQAGRDADPRGAAAVESDLLEIQRSDEVVECSGFRRVRRG